jgi:hypothetical protein
MTGDSPKASAAPRTPPHRPNESQPAKEVQHAPVKLKLDEDIHILHIEFPGGYAEIGFKGELILQRTSSLPVHFMRDGLGVEYEQTQKDWATSRFMSLFNGLEATVDPNGSLTLVGKVGMQTRWFKGTFEVGHDGSLKYEVEARPIKMTTGDMILEGTIGCWIKLKSDVRFDPSWSLKTSLILTRSQLRNLLILVIVVAGTAAAAAAAVSFGEYLWLLGTGALGAASGFIMIFMQPEVIKELQRKTDPMSDPMSIQS